MNLPNRRRLFYSFNKRDFFQIFTFAQEKDGSIYCQWPSFRDTKWVGFDTIDNLPNIKITDTPMTSEKLSLHGSGVVKFKQNDGRVDPERIKGQFLLKNEKDQIAPRHLFTSFMCEPKYLPLSGYSNRKSDTEILANEHQPFVIAFFAIPQQKTPLQISFNPIFNIDLFGEDFAKNIGFGNFSLASHDIIWFAYKTMNITNWPKYNHIFYYDGYFVPLFIGQNSENSPGPKYHALIAVLQEPCYEFFDGNLRITLPFPSPEIL